MHRARAVTIWVVASLVLGSSGLVLALPAGAAVRADASTAPSAATTTTGHWSAPVTLFDDAQGAAVGAVSCASTHSCVAVGTEGGTSGRGVADSGAITWPAPDVIDTNGGLNTASCAPGGPCLAGGEGSSFDGDTYELPAAGGKWATGPTAPVLLNAISCASADFCGAVGFLNEASAFIYNGTAWSAQIPIDADGSSISCPTTTFCAVVSESGDVVYYQDGHWSKATAIDSGRGLSSISCTSASFCAAVDDGGNALVDVDGRWSTPDYAHPLSTGSLTGVSCASAEFCAAVDLGGKAYFWDGSAWSAPQTISTTVAFSSVSCPTTSFCIAGGQGPSVPATTAYVATWSPSSAVGVPSAPTDLKAAAGSGEVGLSWSRPTSDGGSPVTHYTVFWRPVGSSKPESSSPPGTDVSTTITGLKNGSSYQFAVEATNAAGVGSPTGWVSEKPSSTPPPLEPVSLTGSVTATTQTVLSVQVVHGEVDLRWFKPASNGCTSPKCEISSYTVTYTEYDAATPNVARPGTVTVPISTPLAASVDLPLALNLASDTFDVVANDGYGSSPAAAVTLYLELPPIAPRVSESVTTAKEVTLSWVSSTVDQSDIGPISGYKVVESTSVHLAGTEPLTASQYTVQTSSSHQQTFTSVTVTGLADSTKYYFDAFVLDAAGASPTSNIVGATTLGPPGAPPDLAAVRADREVYLSWQPPTMDGGTAVTGYQVFMGTSARGEGTTAVTSPSATSVTLGIEGTHLANGTTYFFTVKAVNDVGTGPASNEVSSTPEPVASSPEGLVASAGGGQVKLTWQAPGSDGGNTITGYDIYRGTAPGAEAATPVQVAATPTSYTAPGLTPGVTYYFYVAAANSVGAGLRSDEVSAAPTAVLYPPSAPADLTAARGDREVLLNWQPPGSDGGSAVTGYRVFMGTSARGRGATTAVASPSSTHVLVGVEGAHLSNGTTYFFTVEAVSAVGTSVGSNQASATPAAVASGPVDLVATAANGSVKLTWEAPAATGSGAITGYDIYQGTAPGGEAATPVPVPASPTSYTVTGLSELKTYYFYLAAVTSVGPGLASGEVSATPQGAPSDPLHVEAVIGDAQVGVSWSPSANDEGSPVTGYTVLWKLGAHPSSSAEVGASTTTYAVGGLDNGDTYQFAVEASNALGTSAATMWVTATPGPDARPLAPQDLVSTVSSPNGQQGLYSTLGIVVLRWKAPPAGGCTAGKCAISGYVLSYDTYPNGRATGVAQLISDAGATSDGLSLPLNLETDTLTLSAVNGYGTGTGTAVAVPLEQVPSAPAVIATTSSGQVVLGWDDLPAADRSQQIGAITGYAVHEGTSAGKENAAPLGPSAYRVQTTRLGAAVDIRVTVTGLDNGTTYYFEVADIDAAGSSTLSNEVSATPT